jgi:hypothetical protein
MPTFGQSWLYEACRNASSANTFSASGVRAAHRTGVAARAIGQALAAGLAGVVVLRAGARHLPLVAGHWPLSVQDFAVHCPLPMPLQP